jgi:hypothetical protein
LDPDAQGADRWNRNEQVGICTTTYDGHRREACEVSMSHDVSDYSPPRNFRTTNTIVAVL